MKLMIKYCGGCNPAYDRVDLVKQIVAQLKDECPDCQISYQNDAATHGLMICGCDACCIDNEENRAGIANWCIIGPDMVNYYKLPLREVPLQIKSILEKGE